MQASSVLKSPIRSSRQERRRGEVHQRILGAAVECFDRAGVEATRIDAICALADVAQKTFFNHFPTKQHLVREIAWTFHNELLAILEEVQALDGSTAERLRQFFRRIAAQAQAASPMRRELVMEVIRLNHADRTEPEQRRHLLEAFEQLLKPGLRRGEVTRAHPLPVLAESVAGSFYVLMLNWLSSPDYPIQTRAAAMGRFLADALSPGASPVRSVPRRRRA